MKSTIYWHDISMKLAFPSHDVAVGDTLQEAIDECKKIAEKVTGHYIDIKLDSFDKANEEFEKLSKMGIKIL